MMRKKYTIAKPYKSLADIESEPRVGNVFLDPAARNEDGEVVIGEDWIVCVATRPIPGTVTWTNADTSPIFWSATDPTSDFGPGHLERCRRLDAAEVKFVTEDQVREITQAFYDRTYPGRNIDVSKYDLDEIWNSFIRVMEEEEEEDD